MDSAKFPIRCGICNVVIEGHVDEHFRSEQHRRNATPGKLEDLRFRNMVEMAAMHIYPFIRLSEKETKLVNRIAESAKGKHE